MKIIGLDIGKISFKAVWLEDRNNKKEIRQTFWKPHYQEINKIWQELKKKWNIGEKDRIVVTGRFRQMLPFSSIVEKVAQEEAARFLYPGQNLTLIRLGGGGFSVLKIRDSGPSEFKQNHRCAAGVGSFLDQIMARVGLNIFKADEIVGKVKGIEITSRCGVTMKTDFTHLLNTQHKLEEVVAGLLDSSAKNAVALALTTQIPSRVLVIGGLSVSRRIVRTVQQSLPQKTEDGAVSVEVPPQALYLEALGAALVGWKIAKNKNKTQILNFQLNNNKSEDLSLVFLPSLSNYLNSVTKIESLKPAQEFSSVDSPVLGLDIGSTGLKLVIFDKDLVFEDYIETQGQPVQAVKKLIQKIPQRFFNQIKIIGCTGSGREIVANLLKASLPKKDRRRIFVLNEIAAHAQGASYYDEDVDTIIDIGGQDAKFTRLEAGRVVDSCMNTVCSAGTGSFLAEQLQLLGVKDVKQFGKMALESPRAVDLGQHCAVFISEQIDEAKRKGATLSEIIAGLYYSIVLNYNNRVKGSRDYGKKIFLQGKPAENLALACALAKVTGQPIIVPPSPGSPGALGIALLAKKELSENFKKETSLNLNGFLESQILEKKEFRCQSKYGCLMGNLCPIQVITVKIGEETSKFFWSGACDKYEKELNRNPVLAQVPSPFIEREKLILELLKEEVDLPIGVGTAVKTVGIPRGLENEEILPLVITFFQEIGLRVELQKSPSLRALEDGAKLCQATFCAPLQLLAGQSKFFEDRDFVFLPKVIEISSLAAESSNNGHKAGQQQSRCYVCPLSQAVPDLFSPKISTEVLQPLLNFRKGYEKNIGEFVKLGLKLGYSKEKSSSAFKKAVRIQREFETKCRKIGERVLDFAKKHQVPVILVLGHPYVINSSLLSAGVPEAIQENGAIPLPADCYPLDNQNFLFQDMYWGYGQRLLQAAWQARRQSGVYPLWLSVYSCGPDSFLLHYFQYLSQGKPYAILESDAHTGQAGFKTRVEAFLYGIKHYKKNEGKLPDLQHFNNKETLVQVRSSKRKLLIPWMGEGTRIAAALFRSIGIESESIPLGTQESLELGRKFTSGKECLPMIVTLGGLLKYLETHQGNFYFLMAKADGPCRFGQYQLLFKLILEKLGLSERVKIISPSSETGYQGELEASSVIMAKTWAGIIFSDFLKDGLLDIRPEEKIPGSTQKVFNRYLKSAEEIITKANNNWFGLRNLWGLKPLAEKAAEDFRRIPREKKKQGKLTVLVTGEIYVRLDNFSNNDVIRELEKLGVKVKLSPLREWVNYTTYLRLKGESLIKTNRVKIYLTDWFQKTIEKQLYQIFARNLKWSKDHRIEEILETAEPYLRKLKPLGEAVLTIGFPLLLWQKGEIAGTVVVGPFECMPCRIAETQLSLISQKTGLPVLNLSFCGDPLEKDLLESFIWDLIK